LTSPAEFLFSLLLVLLSGYATLDLLSRKSPVWGGLNRVKRVLLGFGFGLCLDFGIIVPLILLNSFWTGADWVRAFQNSSYLLFAYSILLFLTFRILRVSERTHLNLLKIFLLSLLGITATETVAVFIISQEVRFYPVYLGYFLIPAWNMFFRSSLIYFLLIFTLGLLGLQFFIISIVDEQLKRELIKQITKIRKTGRNSVRRGLSLIKTIAAWTIKPVGVFSRRRAAIFLLIVVIASAILVPIDMAFSQFTPRLIAEEEVFYPSGLMPDNDLNSIRLTIISLRRAMTSTYNVYVFSQLFQKTYLITQPALPFVKSVYIETPREFISDWYIYRPGYTWAGELPADLFLKLFCFNDWYQHHPGYIGVELESTSPLIRGDRRCALSENYVLSPSDVEVRFNPNENEFKGIEVHFQNTNNTRFMVSLNHWRPMTKPANVSVRYDGPNYIRLENGVWAETHSFIIENNSGTKIVAPSFDFVWTMTDDAMVDRSSIKAYVDKKPCEVLSSADRSRLIVFPDPWIRVAPGSTSTFTISFRVAEA